LFFADKIFPFFVVFININRYTHKSNVFIMVHFFHFFQGRNFGAARTTPRRPDIHQDRGALGAVAMGAEGLGVDLDRMGGEQRGLAPAAPGRLRVPALRRAVGGAAGWTDELAHGSALDLPQTHHVETIVQLSIS